MSYIRLNPTSRPIAMNESATEVISLINSRTTPEEFDLYCEAKPEYQVTHAEKHTGETALHKAAKLGNVALMRHIYAKAGEDGKKLLNAGCYMYGYSALHLAAKDKKLEVARTLIALGAEVNAATAPDNIGNFSSEARGGHLNSQKYRIVTPLYIAAHNLDDNLTRLFLKYNAVVTPNTLSNPGFQGWLDKQVKAVETEKEVEKNVQVFNHINMTEKPSQWLPPAIMRTILLKMENIK